MKGMRGKEQVIESKSKTYHLDCQCAFLLSISGERKGMSDRLMTCCYGEKYRFLMMSIRPPSAHSLVTWLLEYCPLTNILLNALFSSFLKTFQ